MRFNGRTVWLWCWIGVLVAGCNQSVSGTPTLQKATLTLLTLTQTPSTRTPTFWLLRTPSLIPTSRVSRTFASTPLPVMVNAPNCYEKPVGGLLCLGIVQNQLLTPVEQVMVRVYLVTGDGTAIAQREAQTARQIIPPGEDSPYGVLFEDAAELIAQLHAAGSDPKVTRTPMSMSSVPRFGPVTVLLSANEAFVPTAQLEIREAETNITQTEAKISGMVVNRGKTRATALELVVTAYDPDNRVTGYRQFRWPNEQSLDPDQKLPFDMVMIPQGQGTSHITIRADALNMLSNVGH